MEKAEIKKHRYSKASLILGIIGLIGFLVPVIGVPITIVGLVLGVKGYKSSKKGLATAGIVLCIIGMFTTVAIVSIGVYSGVTSELFTSSNGVIFCQNVDTNGNAINASTTFATGEVYVRLKTSSAFNTTKLKVTIYKINGIEESVFNSKEQVVNQNWAVIAVPIPFKSPGKYKVLFTKENDDIKLGNGTVTIK